MSDLLKDVPDRILPYTLLSNLDETVQILPGPFRLTGASETVLDGELRFRWSPSADVEFEGTCSLPYVDIAHEPWTLTSTGEATFSVPVYLTGVSRGPESSVVRGITAGAFDIGKGPFETLRFCLANFPCYFGEAIRFEREEKHAVMRGRLETKTESGCCQLDEIPEVKEVAKRANRDAGFMISHVGMWIPSTGVLSVEEAEPVLEMLHFWFGLLRGGWAGPLFPEGLDREGSVAWRQFGPWKLRESRRVSTWLPQRTPLDLSTAFRGFVKRWHEPVWREPLTTSISWYVEANAVGIANESRIILAQVALELLSWVFLVEAQHMHSRSDFERLSAAGRIRALFHHIGVSLTVPDHLSRLQALSDVDAFDGPGVITKVRNALVHSTEKKRALMELVDGEQRMECAQLALQYVELAILAVCGHDGHYARRGWRRWKGDDEVQVPWTQAG